MTNHEFWYWLLHLEGIGNKKIEDLLSIFTTPKEVFYATEKKLSEAKKLNKKDVSTILYKKDLDTVLKEYESLRKKNIDFVTIEDQNYPERLNNIYNPPYSIYVKGKLPETTSINIAIVGARNCSIYGKEIAERFAYELSKAGINIISGLARGIDGYAHQGAIKGNGATYGVLGCGIDICYPRENIELYMDMQNNGGVLSEYGIGIKPMSGLFPMRNRIISGLSDGIIVIEAKEKSGSLITVDMGLEQGKNIYAVPGKATDILSSGCNNLIKMGAKMVTCPEDILEEYDISPLIISSPNKKSDNLLETQEKIVYASLSLEPKFIEDIINETGIPLNKVIEILLMLQFKNLIREVTRNFYVVKSEL